MKTTGGLASRRRLWLTLLALGALLLVAAITFAFARQSSVDVDDFQISSDNRYVVYVVEQQPDDALEIYSVPLYGSAAPVRLGGLVQTFFSDLQNYAIAPDSSRVVYRADQETDRVLELYSIPIDGSAASQKLNASLVTGGFVFDFAISADSRRVVYLADQETDQVFELYSVPIDGSAAPQKLNSSPVPASGASEFAMVPASGVSEFAISADSRRVVYRADQEGGAAALYSVPLDGGAAPVLLGESLSQPTTLDLAETYAIAPDSSRVVYLAAQDTAGVDELYSVPLDGSAAPQKLNGPLTASGQVTEFTLSADSSRVVYRADQETTEVFELYSVPLDGSAAPQKLNGPLPEEGDVSFGNFAISADSSRVVYRADQETDQVFELYSVPLDGSAAPQKLNSALVEEGNVYPGGFVISADSSRVVYVADQETDEVLELYSVPIDGGAAPQKLNGPLPEGGNVSFRSFAISANSSQVVYMAEQEMDGMFELYSVPIDGGAAPQKLNGSLEASEDVVDFAIGGDGRRVVYRVEQETDVMFELYSVPIDGSAAPQNLAARWW
jgi:Tol biopolymer transport system component